MLYLILIAGGVSYFVWKSKDAIQNVNGAQMTQPQGAQEKSLAENIAGIAQMQALSSYAMEQGALQQKALMEKNHASNSTLVAGSRIDFDRVTSRVMQSSARVGELITGPRYPFPSNVHADRMAHKTARMPRYIDEDTNAGSLARDLAELPPEIRDYVLSFIIDPQSTVEDFVEGAGALVEACPPKTSCFFPAPKHYNPFLRVILERRAYEVSGAHVGQLAVFNQSPFLEADPFGLATMNFSTYTGVENPLGAPPATFNNMAENPLAPTTKPVYSGTFVSEFSQQVNPTGTATPWTPVYAEPVYSAPSNSSSYFAPTVTAKDSPASPDPVYKAPYDASTSTPSTFTSTATPAESPPVMFSTPDGATEPPTTTTTEEPPWTGPPWLKPPTKTALPSNPFTPSERAKWCYPNAARRLWIIACEKKLGLGSHVVMGGLGFQQMLNSLMRDYRSVSR